MATLCLALLAALLLIGAAIDIKSRRLPNWLTASVVVLYGLYALVSPSPLDWTTALAVASIVFLIGFALFAFNLMGGGDVKLLSGLALWAGIDGIALFLLVTGLAGGLMSIGILMSRRLAHHPMTMMLWPFVAVAVNKHLGLALPDIHSGGGAGLAGRSASQADADPAAGSLPYGVAIAAGGFVVIYTLLKL